MTIATSPVLAGKRDRRPSRSPYRAGETAADGLRRGGSLCIPSSRAPHRLGRQRCSGWLQTEATRRLRERERKIQAREYSLRPTNRIHWRYLLHYDTAEGLAERARRGPSYVEEVDRLARPPARGQEKSLCHTIHTQTPKAGRALSGAYQDRPGDAGPF